MQILPGRLLWPIIAALTTFACLQANAVAAQTAAPADDRVSDYSGTTSIVLKVNPDGTSEEVETRRITILAESAVRPQGKQSFSFAASLDRMEVMEAVTEKADGRKISALPSAVVIQDSRLGSDIEESLDTHDLKEQIIIFRDVGVGDSVVATIRKSSKSAFPRQYNRSISVDAKLAPSFTITFNRNRPLYIGTQGDGFSHKVAADGETETHTLEYRAKLPAHPDEPGSIEPRNISPYIHVTSLRDYEVFGRALWEAWSPRLEITPAIRALAEEITRGNTDKRAEAAAIDRWIKRNIRYAWMATGIDGLLPDPVETVLSNRYGHCANRAALMFALLAARDIESEFVLIKKLGSEFSLPKVAVYAFDHALLYLPEFQLYAEPTSVYAAFGILDEKEYDKPVLHFSPKGGRVDRIPAMRPSDHAYAAHTKIIVARDGTISGETAEISTGVAATVNRKLAVDLPAIGSRKQAAEQLRANETPGEGRFEPGAVDTLSEPFVIQSWFKLANRLNTKGDASWLIPQGFVLKDSPDEEDSLIEGYFGARYENRQFPFFCSAGRNTQQIEITFDEGLPLPKPLKGLSIKTAVFSSNSTYRLENRTLKVTREFVSFVPSQICPPALEAVIAEPLKAVTKDLETEITFTRPKSTSSRGAKPKLKQPGAALRRPPSGRG
jgi:hypothetical protein